MQNYDTSVTITNSGVSSAVFADAPSMLFLITDNMSGLVTIEASPNNSGYANYEVNNTVINFSGNKGVQVPGGLYYRANVSRYSSQITMSLTRLLK